MLDRVYETGEYYEPAEDELDRLITDAHARIERLSRLAAGFHLPKRLLDVGCASGHFLRIAADSGWNADGIDRSPELATRARLNSGCSITCGVLEEDSAGEDRYPIVTAWEVLEHARDVRAFFKAVTNKVDVGGLIALSTPLANGIPAVLMGRKFPMLMPPEHLSLFTRRSLRLLAAEFGFTEASYSSFSNLGPRSLASGFARVVLHRKLDATRPAVRSACLGAAQVFAFVPRIVDSLGLGTEMEVVFMRSVQ